ncbi:transglycosylase domain-containing protein [Planomicrobium sp. CPCC 101079]|uniref:transglycosylase domain-containing protein n=1 Tax=Planomicrobium sp. CPCC 101079 TaxID=2599618 RepID=UPI0011B529D6|nr:transglycosylase domain-containing protein [Planomicrobium sp. CPCC 101079]TWT12471.1 penicillin-binding protein [Planomicrobium sp. CPCC 101079]
MLDQLKNWLTKAEESYNKWSSTKWVKRFNITTGVLWNLAILLAIIFVASGVFAASVGAGYFASLVDEEKLRTPEEMRDEVYSYEETSELYFAGEVYFGKLRTDLERTETTLDKVSENAINAVLATEDEYFEEHNGIVPKAIFRGLFQDVSNSDSQTGGSTLTQQLIKNQILTNEVSYERKAKEILLAMRLEKFMSKDEIMEAYLNIIPYGRNSAGTNIAGIETAAKSIFNVSASELNLPQAAYIAGIPKAPFLYTPYQAQGGVLKSEEGLQPGIDRMKTVLFRMKETEYITEEEYNEALAYDITKDFREKEQRAYDKYYYVTTELEKRATRIIMDVLAEKDGIEPKTLDENDKLYEEYAILADRAVRSNGYRIYSTINKDLYDAQQKAKDKYKSYGTTRNGTIINADGEEEEKEFPVQVGSMTIENKTGRILSFIGGRDPEIEKLNHATQGFRSIGSTVKPLLVYGPAIEYGKIGAGSPVVDVKFEKNDNGSVWAPTNFIPTSEQGIMPARDALAQSQNLPALRLYAQINDQVPIKYMMNSGFSRVEEQENYNTSAALGGGIEGSVEEITNGYAMVANGGKFVDSYMIEKIEDDEGNVIFEHKSTEKEVFTPQTAYILTDMLRDVFEDDRGTANRANSLLNFNADFAGKTGTTQQTRDVWLIGYNPNITMGVWLGYDKEKYSLADFPNRDLQPSVRVNQLWASLMNTTYDVEPKLVGAKKTFKQPKDVVTRSFCAISGLAPSGSCSGDGLVKSDLFNSKVMVPSKKDDSLTSGSYTTINGSRYAALDSTPREFVTSGGAGVSQAFVERMLAPFGGDASKLFPGSSRYARVVAGSNFQADGAAPSGVNAALSGGTITWSNSSSNDVVGYRVYKEGSGSPLASISESSENAFSVSGAGSYYVVAVDITGKQSGKSDSVSIEAKKPKAEPKEDEDEEKPAAEEDTSSDDKQDEDKKPADDEQKDEEEKPADNDKKDEDEDEPAEPEEPEEEEDQPAEPAEGEDEPKDEE